MSITRLSSLLLIVAALSTAIFATEPDPASDDSQRSEPSSHSPSAASPQGATPPHTQLSPAGIPTQGAGPSAFSGPAPMRPPGLVLEPRRSESLKPPPAPVPRWLEEVRAQRRALHEQRRAAHEARIEALDPVGTAKRDEREKLRRRRQAEVREMIESERRLYLNRGPWLSPLAPKPPLASDLDPLADGSLAPPEAARDEQPSPSDSQGTPSDWNNHWYYNGW